MPPKVVSRNPATDGSAKLLLELDHGARVEAVHMPRNVGTGRVTLCISSQVGCAMGCTFCATATMGFVRHLRAHEIVGQVLSAMHALGPRHPGELTLVFMGMGEPMHNLDNVEGITLGPKLSDGRQSVVLVTDDNFSPTQITQFYAFAL